jgi:predicted RNase H-like HicB family nuclease
MRNEKSVRIAGNIPVFFMKGKKKFIAFSPAIDLATSGKTLRDAKEKFAEAFDLYVEELVEQGTLDRVLHELGWNKQNREWQPPVEIKRIISVPMKIPNRA